jgi:hypothetical protein
MEDADELQPDAEWWPLQLMPLSNELTSPSRISRSNYAEAVRIPRLAAMVVYRRAVSPSRELPLGYTVYTIPSEWPVHAVAAASRLFTTTDLAELRMWLLRRYAELTT